MITAPETNKTATHKVAFLTLATIFIMGYLNALSLRTTDLGVMITAQSGNIVWLGIDFTQAIMGHGEWIRFFSRISLFLGFAGGAGFALATANMFKNKRVQFYYDWSVFSIPIIIYPLFLQYNIPSIVSLFLLGFPAGATLGFFRKLYHLDVNTSMATGSARFVGLEFVEMLRKKDKKAVFTFFLFLIAVLTFSFGAGIYQFIRNIQPAVSTPEYQLVSYTNIALIIFCVIPYLFYPGDNEK
ncbi:MAG: DUF1275 domain-containing protein [Defluviitaleaceae bacterium]|nr:DUF1275 domain-containing protein [Defluviitaleaceae bacterium]